MPRSSSKPHEVRAALRRHARGDWGEAKPDEVADNERGLREAGGVLSIFRDRRDQRPQFCSSGSGGPGPGTSGKTGR